MNMNKTRLIQLIESPIDISENDLEHLEELIATYPYCQVAHLLIAKFNHDRNGMLAPGKIRRAAAYALDRAILRQLILNENGIIEENSIQLKTQVDQIDQEIEGGLPSSDDEFQFEENTELTEQPEQSQQDNTNQSFFDTINTESPQETTPNPVDNTSDFSPFPEFNSEFSANDESPSEGLLTEGMAITLFHEGKEDEAVRVYQQLAKLHPERKQYFYNQISILKGTEYVPNDPDTSPTTNTENNTSSFFENLEINHEESNGLDHSSSTDSTTSSVYEEYNEGKAMGLYYDGKIDEAIAMYKKLMELYPEKSTHYQEQLNALVGSKASDDAPQDQNTEETTTTNTDQSFFEGIDNQDDTSESPVNDVPETQSPFDNTSDTSMNDEPEAQSLSDDTINQDSSNNNLDSTADSLENTLIDTPKNEETVTDSTTSDDSNQSFFDQINSNDNQDTPPTLSSELANNSNEDLTSSVPDVTSLEPIGLDNAEETDYINESEAIMLFNQGKNAEAIKIYEMLIHKNPQKASYYRSQINVLKDTAESENKSTQTEPEPSFTPEPEKNTQEEDNFTPLDLDASTEEISERAAIHLFNLGNTEEAVAVYEKLMLKYPDKKSYFLSQIEILKS